MYKYSLKATTLCIAKCKLQIQQNCKWIQLSKKVHKTVSEHTNQQHSRSPSLQEKETRANSTSELNISSDNTHDICNTSISQNVHQGQIQSCEIKASPTKFEAGVDNDIKLEQLPCRQIEDRSTRHYPLRFNGCCKNDTLATIHWLPAKGPLLPLL